MADEVTDCSNKEQVAVCFHTVDEDFKSQDSFIGLHVVESIQADVLVRVLKDIMVRMNLSVKNCRGQCYDEAAHMAGSRNGVAKQTQSEEARAIFSIIMGMHSIWQLETLLKRINCSKIPKILL